MAHRGITSFLRHDAPDGGPASLAQALDGRVREGELVERRPDGAVRCVACGRRCLVKPGRRGICKVGFNKDGALQVPAGYVAALQCDPTEKKPFFHALPGSDTLTFGMLGCDFHCGYCQNWLTSQALRDDAAGVLPTDVTPDALVRLALGQGAKLVGSSYNEPLITAEWAVDVFKVARAEGLKTAFISNGNATPEVLDYIRPWTDCYKIDLKAMDDKRYRELGGVLQHVLDAVRMVYERGFWVEIVTLVVPGFNDDTAQLRRAAEYLASVSPEIPWHVTAFHKDYRMTDPDDTSAETLVRACEIGAAAGLKFIYAGNLPGRVGRWENTYCPDCGDLLIERYGYVIERNKLAAHVVPLRAPGVAREHALRSRLADQGRCDHDRGHAAGGARQARPRRAGGALRPGVRRARNGGDHRAAAPHSHVRAARHAPLVRGAGQRRGARRAVPCDADRAAGDARHLLGPERDAFRRNRAPRGGGAARPLHGARDPRTPRHDADDVPAAARPV